MSDNMEKLKNIKNGMLNVDSGVRQNPVVEMDILYFLNWIVENGFFVSSDRKWYCKKVSMGGLTNKQLRAEYLKIFDNKKIK